MILNASGCLDALAAPSVARSLDAYVTKTVTPLPRDGNPPLRIAETSVWMLNSIGLANPGRDAFIRETLPRLGDLGMPIWVSVGGFAASDYAETCAALDGRDDVAAVELNLSCPNADSADESVSEIVVACRAETGKPLYAKLSPAVPDIASLAASAAAAGADGFSLVNTIRGLALDARTLEPVLGTASGGLSGPPLKPIALACIHACRRATDLPIVGMGGIATAHDALEFLATGATHVAVGTALLADPGVADRIRAELEQEAGRDAGTWATAERLPQRQASLEGLLIRKPLQMGRNKRV